MYPALTRCPVCQNELVVSRLHCPSCDTVVEGRFTAGHFANLTQEQLHFIVTFVRCEGKINRMEEELNLSYPTIRNRLHEVSKRWASNLAKSTEITDEKRRSVLEDPDTGKISALMPRILRGEDE
jgi:hypothetical protein